MTHMSKNVTRKDIAKLVANDLSIEKTDALLKLVFSLIAQELKAGKTVNIHEFGKFESKLQKGRTGLVPGTNKQYTTSDKMIPSFKAAKAFKDTVKG